MVFGKNSERELGSQKEYEIAEDGSISYFAPEVSDEVRAKAESERDKALEKRRELAAAEVGQDREVGTPGVEQTEEEK